MNRQQLHDSRVKMRLAIQLMGGQTGLARAIAANTGEPNLVQSHVWHWLNKCRKLPPERAIQIETVTKKQVTRGDLRPDLWPM